MNTKSNAQRAWLPVVAVALAAALLGAASASSPQAAFQLGRQGRLQVRQLEIGYRLADDSLKVRAHLVTGMAIDYRTSEAAETDRILKVTELLATGRAQVFVEIESDAIEAFDVLVPFP